MTFPENELKHALRHQDPPYGFADRIIARVEREACSRTQPLTQESLFAFFMRPFMRWAATVVLASALVASGFYYRNAQQAKAAHERVEGEAAKQQLVLALRIAGAKLQLAKSKINEMNNGQTNEDSKQVKE